MNEEYANDDYQTTTIPFKTEYGVTIGTETKSSKKLCTKNCKYKNNWNELKKFAEDEIIECKAIISTILPEFEKIMPRSSGKTLLTNEYNNTQTIIKCFEVMLNKMQELESK